MKFKESEETIKVESLNITHNIMMWDQTMIQISNVSTITTKPRNPVSGYPVAAILFFLGLLLTQFYFTKVFGFILIAAGIGIALWCFAENAKRQEQTILTIQMNSGANHYFMVENKNTLNPLLKVLAKIIADGGVGSRSVSIKMKDCTIQDNAQLFNGVNIR